MQAQGMTDRNLLGLNVNRIEHLTEKLPSLGLKRAELFIFSRSELPEVKRQIEKQELTVSIHAPVPRPTWYPYPPTWTFLNYLDPEKRNLYVRLVDETVEAAKDLGAKYVVAHFPGPLAEEDAGADIKKLSEIAFDSAARLADISDRYDVDIQIEGFGPSPFLNIEFVAEVLTRHPRLRYCFDIAHSHLAEQRQEIDYYGFLYDLLPYLGSVHVWQSRHVDDYLSHRHIPLHPTQRPEEGWVDVERVVRLVHEKRPTIPFIMEYPGWFPEPWKDLDYREGVRWLQDILEISS